MSDRAVLVVDMLNDFVTGKLKCDRAKRIIPNIEKLVKKAREKDVPVIYVNDAHLPKVDKEFKVWGVHAVKGTKGAEVIERLKPQKSDFTVDKRTYSGFSETGLDSLLRELDVDTVILVGINTDCCIKHTAADAFFRGYKIKVPEDAVEAFSNREHKFGLEYMKKFYNATITDAKESLRGMKRKSATSSRTP